MTTVEYQKKKTVDDKTKAILKKYFKKLSQLETNFGAEVARQAHNLKVAGSIPAPAIFRGEAWHIKIEKID